MLKPAELYKDKLIRLDYEKCYGNLFYQYYYGDSDYCAPFSKSCDNTYSFVSVDSSDDILGYISFVIDSATSTAKWWGVKSYTPSVIFAQDCMKVIDDVFNKYNLERVEWFCYADNPAVRGYEKFIERCGGERVGHLHKERKLLDGKLHDTYIYEILRSGYRRVFKN